jgi:hypothetical protein
MVTIQKENPMLDFLKNGGLQILYSLALPVATWAGKKLMKWPPPTDKEGFREWLIWIIDNRLLSVVQKTPFEIDDKAVTILRDVLDSDILFSLVWSKIHGDDKSSPDSNVIPDNDTNKSFLQKIKDKLIALKSKLLSDENGILLESTDDLDKETESVAVAIGIISLIINAPQALKSLAELLDYIKTRRNNK